MSYTGYQAFCISYDLKAPGKDYTPLYNALKGFPKWWHYLQSTWIVATPESAIEVWNRLATTIDANDFLLIIEVRANYQGWLPKEAWDWIAANVPA